MAFDPARLLALPPIETRHVFSRRDTILYALGVGAGDLPFVYEEGLRALPTMAVILGYPGFIWRDPAYGCDWTRILHGETTIELSGELPVEGEVTGLTRFLAVDDKGAAKGAAVFLSRQVIDSAGTLLATVRNTSFLRGDGGCGSAGQVPAPGVGVPDRVPDHVEKSATAANQSLIYRLSGDLNPLHVDRRIAAEAGFDRPILHGLCTYGVVGRALLSALCDDRPERMRRLGCRFTSPVFPGETIETRIWYVAPGQAAFQARVVERDIIVLANGIAETA